MSGEKKKGKTTYVVDTDVRLEVERILHRLRGALAHAVEDVVVALLVGLYKS